MLRRILTEVNFKDIRTSQYIVVKQDVRNPGPRLHATALWAGKVREVNGKWLKIKHGGMEQIVAQQGTEKFFVLSKKEFDKFIKEYNDEGS